MRLRWIGLQLCGLMIFFYPFAKPRPVIRKRFIATSCAWRPRWGNGHWQDWSP